MLRPAIYGEHTAFYFPLLASLATVHRRSATESSSDFSGGYSIRDIHRPLALSRLMLPLAFISIRAAAARRRGRFALAKPRGTASDVAAVIHPNPTRLSSDI